jgi:hypothetical protein
MSKEVYIEEVRMILDTMPDFSSDKESIDYLNANPFPRGCQRPALLTMITALEDLDASGQAEEWHSRAIIGAAWDRYCMSRGVYGVMKWNDDGTFHYGTQQNDGPVTESRQI